MLKISNIKRACAITLIVVGLAWAGTSAKAQVVYGGGTGYTLGGNIYGLGNGFWGPPIVAGNNGIYAYGGPGAGYGDLGYYGYPGGYYPPANEYDPAAVDYGNAAMGNGQIPRTSDAIEALVDKDGKLHVTWRGEPRAVQQIRVELLDKSRKVLSSRTISRLPADARLTLTSKTAYYRVQIEYVNGTTTTVVSPL